MAEPRRARGATDSGAAKAAGHDGRRWNPSPGRERGQGRVDGMGWVGRAWDGPGFF